MAELVTPGVYREEIFPRPTAGLRTGVPAFAGLAGDGPFDEPTELTLWPQFEESFGAARTGGYLAAAVRGFFENGGRWCFVVRLQSEADAETALNGALAALAPLSEIDLVCAPDLHSASNGAAVRRMQARLLEHCDDQADRMALLDSAPGASIDGVLAQRRALAGTNGALYYPWVVPRDRQEPVPPCGHLAGVIARTDAAVGVHKAPANEPLEGVLDLEVELTDADQGHLNPEGVNALRVFPGRGIRVWGARTVSAQDAWRYVSVRRLFLTAGRWIERRLTGVAFEPNDQALWARISRELTTYFDGLFQRGALKGATPAEAFYVKCDAETNPPEVRDLGRVVTEIGLAPSLPNEFVVIRIVHGASGIEVSGPGQQ